MLEPFLAPQLLTLRAWSFLHPPSRESKYICRPRHVLAQTVRCSLWSTPMPSKASAPPNLISSSKLVLFPTNALLLKIEAQGKTLARLLVRSQTGRRTTDGHNGGRSARIFLTELCSDFVPRHQHTCTTLVRKASGSYIFGPGSTTTSTLPKRRGRSPQI